jgi:lysophospholipase L1-like esterase
VTRTTFALSQLSNLDYFHPNPAGQRLLADTTWRAAYWA